MKFSSIRIEGVILTGDILDKIEGGEVLGQKAADFGLSSGAKALLDSGRPSGDLIAESRATFLHNELSHLPKLRGDFDKVAEERSKHLVEAHERFSQFMDQKQFQVVYPVLPMDVLGIYVLLRNRRNGEDQ